MARRAAHCFIEGLGRAGIPLPPKTRAATGAQRKTAHMHQVLGSPWVGFVKAVGLVEGWFRVCFVCSEPVVYPMASLEGWFVHSNSEGHNGN